MKNILLSIIVVIAFGFGTFAQNGAILTNYQLDWHWVDADGSDPRAWNDACCGGTVFMVNDCRFNVSNTSPGLSIGNQVSTGIYRIRALVSGSSWTTVANIPAANWGGGDIISLAVNQCQLNNPSINWDVQYIQNQGPEISPYDGAYSLSKGYYLYVRNVPVNATAANPTTCLGSPVQLNATGAQNYIWSPSTGLNNVNIANPLFTTNSAGTYTFNVSATTTFQTHNNNISFSTLTCTGSDQVTVNVVNGPDVDLGEDRIVCSMDDFPISMNGHTPGAVNYEWTFINQNGTTTLHDGTSSSWPANQPGDYCVTVTDQNGCTSIDCIHVIVFGVDANIQANSTVLCGNNPNPITLSATPLQFQNVYSYLWSTNATTETIDVTMPGTYTVIVTSMFGCADEATITITQLDFDFNNVNYCFEDCYFSFTPNLSAPTGTTLSYNWDFGNGITSNLMNPFVNFQYYGVNDVTLTVTANTGSQTCDYVHTMSVFNNCPDAKCKADADFTVSPETIYFDGSVRYILQDNSSAGAGTVVNTQWTVTQNGLPYASYNTPNLDVVLSPGIYEFCLTITAMATDGVQCIDTHCQTVKVSKPKKSEKEIEIKGITVSPNPSNGMFVLELDENVNSNQTVAIEVYNTQGKKVYERTENGGLRFEINLTELPSGIYQLAVLSADQKLTEKLVIQN